MAIPIYLMYRELGLTDTRVGMILLYTAVNVSLAVWLLKGFIDEIPREYEEAALVDGYTRLQAFRKAVLPQAVTGIAATAIFCLIFSWNEYAFALLLTSGDAQTMPPFIPFIIGEGGQDWPAVAAATTLFLVPIVFFTVDPAQASAARHHLRRGAQMSEPAVGRRWAWKRWFRRGPWENGATALIGLGIVMLMQPVSIDLYGYSFVDDPGRNARFRRRQPFSGLRQRMAADPGGEASQGLRRVRRRAGLDLHHRKRIVLRHARPVRLRQDDDLADDRRPGAADARGAFCSTARMSRFCAPRSATSLSSFSSSRSIRI